MENIFFVVWANQRCGQRCALLQDALLYVLHFTAAACEAL